MAWGRLYELYIFIFCIPKPLAGSLWHKDGWLPKTNITVIMDNWEGRQKWGRHDSGSRSKTGPGVERERVLYFEIISLIFYSQHNDLHQSGPLKSEVRFEKLLRHLSYAINNQPIDRAKPQHSSMQWEWTTLILYWYWYNTIIMPALLCHK